MHVGEFCIRFIPNNMTNKLKARFFQQLWIWNIYHN